MQSIQLQKVNQVFKKLQGLQVINFDKDQIQEDKSTSKVILQNNLKLLEDKLQLIDNFSQEGFDQLQKLVTYKTKELKVRNSIEEHNRQTQTLSQNFQYQLEMIEKKCSQNLQKWINDTSTQNQEKFDIIQGDLESLLLEADSIENETVGKQKAFYQRVFEQQLPMINQELDHEFMILDKFEKDFDNQINKSFGLLKQELETQKVDRIQFSAQFEHVMKSLQSNFMSKIEDLKNERIQKQDNMLKLIDQIVSKIKDELLNSDEDE